MSRAWPAWSFLVYRYRYLVGFTLIGLLSLLVEVGLACYLLPAAWPWLLRATIAFVVGLGLSFLLNATVNFRVNPAHLRLTFIRYTLVAVLSFAVNMLAVEVFHGRLAFDYVTARLACSGALFLLAYTLHRWFTFDLARNFGIAVYASADEDVAHIHRLLGSNCDHIHVDLVDETMNSACAPVDLTRLDDVKRFWPGVPVCLHLMSLSPGRWLGHVWDRVDWVLLHVGGREDLAAHLVEGRLRGKKVGVAWHAAVSPAALLPYLPHVDFVLVLGIAQPGRSGQPLLEQAVGITDFLDSQRRRYGYEVIIDGGVRPATLSRIRARYVVAASAVLRAAQPVQMAHTLRTGARYERRSA